jgi:hypothetical protein
LRNAQGWYAACIAHVPKTREAWETPRKRRRIMQRNSWVKCN